VPGLSVTHYISLFMSSGPLTGRPRKMGQKCPTKGTGGVVSRDDGVTTVRRVCAYKLKKPGPSYTSPLTKGF